MLKLRPFEYDLRRYIKGAGIYFSQWDVARFSADELSRLAGIRAEPILGKASMEKAEAEWRNTIENGDEGKLVTFRVAMLSVSEFKSIMNYVDHLERENEQLKKIIHFAARKEGFDDQEHGRES